LKKAFSESTGINVIDEIIETAKRKKKKVQVHLGTASLFC
jgi:hypothetical protein